MSTQLGEAQIPIRATLDKLDADLAAARGKVQNAIAGIAQNVQKVGGVALGIGGAGIAAIGALGAAVGKLAFDAAPVEGLASAFDGLAESAGTGADEMLAALKRGSAGMVSQRDLMMSFNQAAQLVSLDFAQQLPDAMQYLGKVSAATGQDMGFMLDSLVKGVGRLSPMILDNLGIQVSLEEATARAAEMFGVEASELDKAQTQAGMMNVVLEKLAANTAAMPDVSESAAAKMAQLKATFQDTKDQIGMAFLPTLNTLMGVLADVGERVLPLVTRALDAVAPVLEAVAKAVETFVAGLLAGEDPIAALGEALQDLLPADAARAIVDALAGIRDGVRRVVEAVAPYVRAAWEWISKTVELQDVLIALAIAIGAVVLPVLWSIVTTAAPIIAAAVALIAVVTLLRKAWESDFLGIRTFIQETFAAIQQWWAEHGGQVIGKAVEIYQQVRDAIGNALGAIRGLWEAHGGEVVSRAGEAYQRVRGAIASAVAGMKGVVQGALEAMRGFWARNGADITLIVQTFLENARRSFEVVLGAIWTVISTVVGAIVAFWRNNWDVVQGIARATWETIQQIVGHRLAAIEAVIGAVAAAIRGDWTAFGAHLREAFGETWGAITAIAQNAVGAVQAVLGRLWDNLTTRGGSALGGLSDLWQNTLLPALQAVWGFVQDSVIAAFQWLFDLFTSVGGPAIAALQGLWQNVLLPALQAVWGFLQESVVPLFQALFDLFTTVGTIAITALQGLWQNLLLPALQAVWGFVQTSLLPLFQALFDLFTTVGTIAITALQGLWQNVLLPALQAVWGFVQDSVIAVFETLFDLFTTVGGAAITALQGLWQDTLLPALQAVWGFVQDSVIAVFETLFGLFATVGVGTLTAAQDLWQNVLLPALQAVWGFVTNSVIPTFEKIWSFIVGNVIPAIADLAARLGERLLPILDKVEKFLAGAFKRALDGISTAISRVTDWVRQLIEKLSSIQLPDWLTPGSPTPFEIGLVGIAEALHQVSHTEIPRMARALSKLNAPLELAPRLGTLPAFELPPLTAIYDELVRASDQLRMRVAAPYALQAAAPAGAEPAGVVIHNHFGADSVRGDEDIYRLSEQITRSLELRGYRRSIG